MADLTLKRFDTWPPVTAALSDVNGAINLTTASAVHMELKSTQGTLMASLGCTIASAAGGVITHTWSATETAMADTWQTEWEILWAAGGVQTVPNTGQLSISIIPDLEGS